MDSPAWFARRRSWIGEWAQITGTEPSCLVCGGKWSDLHHRSYDRACHDQLHARLERNPEWRKRPRPQATDALVAHMRRRREENVDDDRR